MKITIVNKTKFIRSVIILVALIFLILLGMTNTYSKTEVAYKENYILDGDTLWSVAEEQTNTNEYYKNKDIREVVYEIKKINNIEDGKLEIGQKIVIPYYNI
ncbi:MAG: LysM peptidoglycan-binding domain-containing protein [Clostridia bacterium]|nr:LysM peptidoglycan-binding domain-containing protein [Clostridia bacterium]